MNSELLAKAKSLGFSDRQIAHLTGATEDNIRALRQQLGLGAFHESGTFNIQRPTSNIRPRDNGDRRHVGAHRVRGRAFRRRGDGAAATHAFRNGGKNHPRVHARDGARAARRRIDERAIRRERRNGVRARSQSARVTLGPAAPATIPTQPHAQVPPPGHASPSTNTIPDISAALRQLGANTNFIREIQSQFLSAAGPEANQKFEQMVSGLMSGSLNVNDVRAQAKSAADQLRALQRELGEDVGFAVDGYLSILDGFLERTAPAAKPPPRTNAPPHRTPSR